MTTLHLLCGLMGSGKSTLARQLSTNDDVVRFTLDEWMLRLYPAELAGNLHLADLIEEPDEDEGMVVVHHRPTG